MAYTKRDKNTVDSEIFFFKPDKWFKIWFYIVGEVKRKDVSKWKRGENRFSYAKITDATGASKQQIYKCLDWLQKNSMIETYKDTRGMTIKVLNYAKYQDVKTNTGDREETERRQRGDTEVDTKAEERKKEEIIIPPYFLKFIEAKEKMHHQIAGQMKKNKTAFLKKSEDAYRKLRKEYTDEDILGMLSVACEDDFRKNQIMTFHKLLEKKDGIPYSDKMLDIFLSSAKK